MQKYGLKKLIVEWATTIINSIRAYISASEDDYTNEAHDSEVALFAKILKNEIDEGFYYVQVHISASVKQYSREILRQKWPLKPESDLTRQMTELVNSKTRMDDFLWKRLLVRLYP